MHPQSDLPSDFPVLTPRSHLLWGAMGDYPVPCAMGIQRVGGHLGQLPRAVSSRCCGKGCPRKVPTQGFILTLQQIKEWGSPRFANRVQSGQDVRTGGAWGWGTQKGARAPKIPMCCWLTTKNTRDHGGRQWCRHCMCVTSATCSPFAWKGTMSPTLANWAGTQCSSAQAL